MAVSAVVAIETKLPKLTSIHRHASWNDLTLQDNITEHRSAEKLSFRNRVLISVSKISLEFGAYLEWKRGHCDDARGREEGKEPSQGTLEATEVAVCGGGGCLGETSESLSIK